MLIDKFIKPQKWTCLFDVFLTASVLGGKKWVFFLQKTPSAAGQRAHNSADYNLEGNKLRSHCSRLTTLFSNPEQNSKPLFKHDKFWCVGCIYRNVFKKIDQRHNFKFYQDTQTLPSSFSKSFRDVLKAENQSHQWVPLPSDYMFDSSITQRKAADGAALAVSDEKATPLLFGSGGQTRWLSQASFMRVCVISVLLISTSSKAHTLTLFILTAITEAEK